MHHITENLGAMATVLCPRMTVAGGTWMKFNLPESEPDSALD